MEPIKPIGDTRADTKPKVENKTVYFHSTHDHLGFFYDNTNRAVFVNNWLITDNPAIIAYVRKELLSHINLDANVTEHDATGYKRIQEGVANSQRQEVEITELTPDQIAALGLNKPVSSFTSGPINSVTAQGQPATISNTPTSGSGLK